MGEAKRRGSFEDRRAQSIERKAEEEKQRLNRLEIEKKKHVIAKVGSRKVLMPLSMVAAMATVSLRDEYE